MLIYILTLQTLEDTLFIFLNLLLCKDNFITHNNAGREERKKYAQH